MILLLLMVNTMILEILIELCQIANRFWCPIWFWKFFDTNFQIKLSCIIQWSKWNFLQIYLLSSKCNIHFHKISTILCKHFGNLIFPLELHFSFSMELKRKILYHSGCNFGWQNSLSFEFSSFSFSPSAQAPNCLHNLIEM